MTEEEKKAIEVLKNKRPSEQMLISGKMCVDILINLIEKQDKMIDLMAEDLYRYERNDLYLEWYPNYKRILREGAEKVKEKYRKKIEEVENERNKI